MACSASSCQSNCSRAEQEDRLPPPPQPDSIATGLCFKCKVNPPISSGGGPVAGDAARFCGDCFRGNLFGKFRQAVTANAMITPSDKVLIAFSGGSSSRVALQFVHDLQDRAQKNFDASRDRSLPVFSVGVAFIDESSVSSVPSHDITNGIEEIKQIVSNLTPPAKELHVVPIERVFSLESSEDKYRLGKLLDSVSDATGKEDLLLHLRMLSLQKIASENGYNRLVLGSCTSRIACDVLSATVKGRGFSLAADIQYVDARWHIPIVLPLRDCLAEEFSLLCQLDGLKTLEMIKRPRSGINGLISSFVKLLQQENPSRESTIVRTAEKLTPFHFNRITEINDSNVPLATRRRQKRNNLTPKESISSESFCDICNSPLSSSDLLSSGNSEIERTGSAVASVLSCASCRFQILPKDPTALANFHALLPRPFVAKHSKSDNLNLLRAQIEDCLLSDHEDETD